MGRLGEPVGPSVGSDEGICEVGPMEGLDEGEADGSVVGLATGEAVGYASMVGRPVGSEVLRRYNEAKGDTLGPRQAQ